MTGGERVHYPTNEATVRSAGRPLPVILQRRLLGALLRLSTVRCAGHRLVPALVDAQPPQGLLARLPIAYTSSSTGATIAQPEGSSPLPSRRPLAGFVRGPRICGQPP